MSRAVETIRKEFRPGAHGIDPQNPMALARFIFRASNRRAVEQVAAMIEEAMLADETQAGASVTASQRLAEVLR